MRYDISHQTSAMLSFVYPTHRCPAVWRQWLIIYFVCHLLFGMSLSANVKIMSDTSVSRNIDYNALKSTKGQPSNYTGPQELRYLVGQCFVYSADKYDYRVCPFANVTQHERVVSAGSATAYNGIIGLWKEWSVRNYTFDSLMFYNGDDCGKDLERSARMVWVCDTDATETVLTVKETKRCFYEIEFASEFGCDDSYRYIYPHLSQDLRHNWDQIKTDYFYDELTHFGYDWSVRELLINAGIVLNGTLDDEPILSDNKMVTIETKADCLDQLTALKKQNIDLIKRIKELEIELNYNKTIV